MFRARRIVRLAATALVALALSFAVAPAAWGADEGTELHEGLLMLRVKGALLAKLGTDGLRVGVDVAGSKVTLTGEVEKRSTEELAKEVALGVDGVSSVDNRLTVAKSDGKTPVAATVADAEREVADAALETRVKVRLVGEIGRYGLRIEVEATDGVVSLRGKVPDTERERLALAAARAVDGVKKVVDLLDVG